MLKLLVALGLLCTAFGAAVAQVATLLPNGEQQYFDNNGAPLGAGTACYYVPNTLTPKQTWQDPNAATPNTSPCVTLDAAGRAIIYGSGQYRQRILDINGQVIWDQLTQAATAGGMIGVMDNATLKATATSLGPQGVWRLDFAAGNGAPPLFYVPETGSCVSNSRTSDNGSCVDTTAGDGNSWVARFPNGLIDIREFGAIANNSTDAAAAIASDLLYAEGIGACAYVPSVYPGFSSTTRISLTSGSSCITGDRGLKNFPTIGASGAQFGKFADLNFPNDSDGIYVSANNGWYVGRLALKGNAVLSASATHTYGINIVNTFEGRIENLFVQNFVVCKGFQAPNRLVLSTIMCDDQGSYPNVTNDYPYACSTLANFNSSGATAAFQEDGGECRAAAGGADTTYTGNGSTEWFQVCVPVTGPSSGTIGTQISCSGASEYGVPLWRADGVKVRVGSGTTLPNGQLLQNAPLKTCGVDYTVFDVSASGGGGTGGTAIYCNSLSATLANNSTTVTVGSTSGIPVGTNILVTANEGIPLATKIVSITDGTHFVMSNPAYFTGSQQIAITQTAIATGGSPGYSRTCQTTAGQGTNFASCGYKIEVRFGSPPGNSVQVQLQWSDPTGYAAYYATAVSDYLFIRPMMLGGWDVGLKHTGLSDGGIEFRPTYVELLNTCATLERSGGGGGTGPYGDVLDFHRVINDPIPNCPGYVDSLAANTTANFNNNKQFLNDASPYAAIKYTPTDTSGATLTLTTNNCFYSDIQSPGGFQIHWICNITFPTTVSGSSASISMPISAATNAALSGTLIDGSGVTYYSFSTAGGSNMGILNSSGMNITNSTLSTKTLQWNLIYAGAN